MLMTSTKVSISCEKCGKIRFYTPYSLSKKSCKLCKDCCHTHRESTRNSRLYCTWVNMKTRCINPNYKDFNNYGGRGIKVCQEWNDYLYFKVWATSNGYKKDLTLDRTDNNLDYTADNCRWITIKEQQHNRRNNKLNKVKAKEIRNLFKTNKFSINQLASKFNVHRSSIELVIRNKTWI